MSQLVKDFLIKNKSLLEENKIVTLCQRSFSAGIAIGFLLKELKKDGHIEEDLTDFYTYQVWYNIINTNNFLFINDLDDFSYEKDLLDIEKLKDIAKVKGTLYEHEDLGYIILDTINHNDYRVIELMVETVNQRNDWNIDENDVRLVV